jgi:carbon monoxide dehydrogenase subunit G
MAGQFEGKVEIDRPVEEVFAFLADGENDPTFSPRVQQIKKTTDGPTGVGTVYESTVKDAGMTTGREFRISAFEAPTTIRWTELSKNLVTSVDGGYDLEATPEGTTRLRIFNTLEGHGVGKLLVGLALSAARKDADAFAGRIKAAVEAAIPAAGAEPGAVAEPVAVVESVAVAEPVVEPDVAAEPVVVVEEVVAVAVVEPEVTAEPVAEPEVAADPEAGPVAEPETVAEPAAAPEAEPAATPEAPKAPGATPGETPGAAN